MANHSLNAIIENDCFQNSLLVKWNKRLANINNCGLYLLKIIN